MRLVHACVAEVIGTFLLVLFGTGAVAAAVLTGAQVGIWQVAAVWGFGITLAIYATATISGAHLNPAVSLAFAIFRRREFPLSRLLPYWGSQLLGGILGGVAVLLIFGSFISRFEGLHGLERGAPGSEASAMVFGQYFPNPAIFGTGPEAAALVSPLGAAAIEGLGTGILVLVIFVLADPRSASLPTRHLAPFFIGFAVAVLISVFAPLTLAGWNPARDFGPRLVSYFAGWGTVAIPGPSAAFWVYIAGPLLGGPLGAAVYEFLLRPGLRRTAAQVEGRSASLSDGNGPEVRPDARAMEVKEVKMDGVLFVCVHNAGRSQMAKAIFNQMAQELGLTVRAESAGTQPVEQVHPNVVSAMRELGLDLSSERPRMLTNQMLGGAQKVVTMGCSMNAEACLAVFVQNVEDWGLPDPRDLGLEEVRGIRDTIRQRVEQLMSTLAP